MGHGRRERQHGVSARRPKAQARAGRALRGLAAGAAGRLRPDQERWLRMVGEPAPGQRRAAGSEFTARPLRVPPVHAAGRLCRDAPSSSSAATDDLTLCSSHSMREVFEPRKAVRRQPAPATASLRGNSDALHPRDAPRRSTRSATTSTAAAIPIRSATPSSSRSCSSST